MALRTNQLRDEMSATKYPNAFERMQVDLGRYRTGETPEVGDTVSGHGRDVCLSDATFTGKFPTGECVVEAVELRFREIRLPGGVPWYAARFDLLSRAAPAKPAEEVGEAPAAVIQGPGWYLEKSVTDDGTHGVAEVVGRAANGKWVGLDSERDPCGWNDDGTTVFGMREFDITGPYVEPPKPVLTIEEVGRVTIAGTELVLCESVFNGKPGESAYYAAPDVLWGRLREDNRLSLSGCCHAFSCTAADWPRVQELVAKVNAEPRVQPAAE